MGEGRKAHAYEQRHRRDRLICRAAFSMGGFMNNEQLRDCLEQKALLLTRILDVTKQIESRCGESEIRLDDLLEQRGAYMDRVDKCDSLIARLTDGLPADERQALQNALGHPEQIAETADPALDLIRKCHHLTRQAISLDHSARRLLERRYEDVRESLNASRRESPGHSPFHG